MNNTKSRSSFLPIVIFVLLIAVLVSVVFLNKNDQPQPLQESAVTLSSQTEDRAVPSQATPLEVTEKTEATPIIAVPTAYISDAPAPVVEAPVQAAPSGLSVADVLTDPESHTGKIVMDGYISSIDNGDGIIYAVSDAADVLGFNWKGYGSETDPGNWQKEFDRSSSISVTLYGNAASDAAGFSTGDHVKFSGEFNCYTSISVGTETIPLQKPILEFNCTSISAY